MGLTDLILETLGIAYTDLRADSYREALDGLSVDQVVQALAEDVDYDEVISLAEFAKERDQ